MLFSKLQQDSSCKVCPEGRRCGLSVSHCRFSWFGVNGIPVLLMGGLHVVEIFAPLSQTKGRRRNWKPNCRCILKHWYEWNYSHEILVEMESCPIPQAGFRCGWYCSASTTSRGEFSEEEPHICCVYLVRHRGNRRTAIDSGDVPAGGFRSSNIWGQGRSKGVEYHAFRWSPPRCTWFPGKIYKDKCD